MKNIFDQQKLEHHLVQFLEIGRAYFQEEQGLKFLEAVINYILQATEIETDKFVDSVARISEKGGEIAMTTAEKIRQKGLQKGSQQTMVSLVHNARKKGLSEELIAQIANLDITMVKRILNNESVNIPLHLLQDTE